MKYLIRVIDMDYWRFEYNPPLKPFEAKPIGNLNIDPDNNLSVFEYNDSSDELEKIMLGTVLKRQNANMLQFVKLDYDLINRRFGLLPNKGKTKIQESDDAHRDIPLKTTHNAILCAKIIYKNTIIPGFEFISKDKVKNLIYISVENGTVDYDSLNCALRNVYDKEKKKRTA